jgi:hypothetical protein
MFLHRLEERDDDFGTGSDENLTFPSLLRVVDRIERIVQDRSAHHGCGDWRFSMAINTKEVSTITLSAFGVLSIKSVLWC